MKIPFRLLQLAILAAAWLWPAGFSHAMDIQVKEGDPAPEFALTDQNGRMVHLSDYAGKEWVVLYFYPKDDTPGCTTEACSFRDNLSRLQTLHTAVLGISLDDAASHQKFAKKYTLNFPILSDTEQKVCTRYGTLTRFLGKTVARRSTFLIDPQGVIRKIFPDVEAHGHALEIAEALHRLQGVPGKPR
jgi:peroxiredoxin Q/BCP